MGDFSGAGAHDGNPLRGSYNPSQPPGPGPRYRFACHTGRRRRKCHDPKESPWYVSHIQAGQFQLASAKVLLRQRPRPVSSVLA